MISIFSNTLGAEEHEVLKQVFESRWIGVGNECEQFEAEFARHLNVSAPQVLLYNSCTSAIYVGLRALGIGPGDEVIIASINFVACANAVIELGAVPVFADVDPRTLNILPEEISRLKTDRTKAVILLHYGGHPAPVDEIRAACGDDILLFEDSANSVASTYHGRSCGTLGDGGVWSFDAMKILSMGDGGALYLRNPAVAEKAGALRFLGLANNTVSGKDAMENDQDRWWEYQLEDVSGRFVSNDIAAAIGRVQLRKLPSFIQRRKAIWDYYQTQLASIPELILPPEPAAGCTSSYYLYWVQVAARRDELAHYLAQNGVYTTFRYFPLHQVAFYDAQVSLPNAEQISQTTLNIPLHQNLTDEELEKIVSLIQTFFRKP
jgi:aminotransferase